MVTVVILLVLGVVLLFLETILPGLVAGIAGIGCLIGAIVISYTQFSPETGHIVLTLVLVGLIIGFGLWAKYFPGSRVARLFISKGEVGNVAAEKPELLGQTGTAFTVLRPSGTAVIHGKRVDVVTEGPFIEQGAPIEVVATEGLRVVVRAQTPTGQTTSSGI